MDELNTMEEILIRELTKEEQKALDDGFEDMWKELKGDNNATD